MTLMSWRGGLGFSRILTQLDDGWRRRRQQRRRRSVNEDDYNVADFAFKLTAIAAIHSCPARRPYVPPLAPSPLCQVPRLKKMAWHISRLNEVEFWVLSRKQCRQQLPNTQSPRLPQPRPQPRPRHAGWSDYYYSSWAPAHWIQIQIQICCVASMRMWNGWEECDDDADVDADADADNWWLLHLMQIFREKKKQTVFFLFLFFWWVLNVAAGGRARAVNVAIILQIFV